MYQNIFEEVKQKFNNTGPETNPIGLHIMKRLKQASEQTRAGNIGMARAIYEQLADELEILRAQQA